MSREDDDAYFQRLNEEGIGIWDEGDSQPASKAAPRQAPPLPPARHRPTAAVPPQTAHDDNDYFANLSVFRQGETHEAPTMRIPHQIIEQLSAGIVPGQQQAEPLPTKVEYRKDGFVEKMSGSLAETPRENQNAPPSAPQNRGGGWSR